MKTRSRKFGLSLIVFLALFVSQVAFAFYNPEIGRWVNRDPIGEAGGINLHGFVANNPINMVDLVGHTGFQFTDPFGKPIPMPKYPGPTEEEALLFLDLLTLITLLDAIPGDEVIAVGALARCNANKTLVSQLEELGGGVGRPVPTPKGAPQFIYPNGVVLRFDLQPGQYLKGQGPHINLEIPGHKPPNIHIPLGH